MQHNKDTKMAKKNLFKTPNLNNETPKLETNEELNSLMKQIEVEMQVENNFKEISKDVHEKRLNNMKKILEESSKDEWKFCKIEDLIKF